MAVEYIYDVIRASSGSDMDIRAFITDENEAPITEGCKLLLLDIEDELITESVGVYEEEEAMWCFHLDAGQTADYRGKFWYAIVDDAEGKLHFQQPFYLV